MKLVRGWYMLGAHIRVAPKPKLRPKFAKVAGPERRAITPRLSIPPMPNNDKENGMPGIDDPEIIRNKCGSDTDESNRAWSVEASIMMRFQSHHY